MDITEIRKNSYFQGAISGMFGILLSQPIDSLKTHYQVNVQKQFQLSIKNLYKGVTSPLIGVGIEKSLVFGTYNYLRKNNYNIFLSGSISGLVASCVVTPYERIKILSQTNHKLTLSSFMPKTLFKGLTATFTREIPGFGIYFSTYEYLKNKFYTSQNKDITLYSSFIFGGISGSMAWIFIYPQDRIKTIIQSSNHKINISTLISQTYKNGGIKQFYNGFMFAIIRAIMLHSGTFCMMELLCV